MLCFEMLIFAVKMKNFPKILSDKLQQRQDNNAVRNLAVPHHLIDFASNDYLGFSQSEEIFKGAHNYLISNGIIVNGSTGSRLITGNHTLYDITEKFLCDFHNSDSALIFNSGYDANIGFFSSVPQKGDVVLYDEYIHASIRDGLRLANANSFKFRHNDLENLEVLIKRHKKDETAEIYVVTESVFSMDGDSPDLVKLSKICDAYNCRLVIDEAHAVGIFGIKGEGLVQNFGLENSVFARIVTFGKAPGCHGAAIFGQQQLKNYLVNFARSFIYTTALPPHSLAVILAAYNHLKKDDIANRHLKSNIAFFRQEIRRLNLEHLFIQSASAIHCAVIPGNNSVKAIALTLQQKGYNVKAILSPTVPQGQERLRFCLHSFNTHEQITGLLLLLAHQALP